MDHVRLAELCTATSLFTDLGTGQPTEHGLRTCLTAMRLADGLGLEARARPEVFYVSLVRFLGCTADAHQVAALAGGDEIRFLAGMAPMTMGSPRAEVLRMVSLVAAGHPIPQRLLALARALTDPRGKEQLLDAHCEVAARLSTEMGLPAGVADALEVAYARWDGRGVPTGIGGQDIPVSVRVSIVARDAELWVREAGVDTARRVLRERRGRAYDPDVVDAALGIGLETLCHYEDDLWDATLDLEPSPRLRVSGTDLLQALAALGDFADLKLPERSGYSRRVARIASRAGEVANLDAADTDTLARAALVHDLGVVAVPTDVWRSRHRPGSAGWEQIRLHPLWTARVLSRCPGLERVATVARRHHERRDGSGYPVGLTGDLDQASSLLACAVLFDEMSAASSPGGERPSPADVAAQMVRLARSGAMDRGDVNAVLGAVGIAAPPVEVERPVGLTEREVEVLSRLALGATNRQIAETLGISAKTVGAHVEHIYTKAGVRSRAAATLFAMRHHLVG
ncbi:HD domain-containing protein [Nocardia uniformis]|uniref:HD domain-containing protein n=1 Tax=Nocardia uniformis TaxID=53432 RepID=A0A849BVK7_9NOCA|nr:HD domain-containing phosphohydrolase [Nocardia uniformis]NNH68976.1 HD domain-containing protein [Nocardia uniformis]